MSDMTVSKTNFKPAPAGKFHAVACDVVDEGFQKNPFDTENPDKLVRKVSIHFQLLDAPEDPDFGIPKISKWFTFSLNEKSALAKFMCEWFECGYSAIPNNYDLENLVGQNARLRIIHEPRKDGQGERAIIQSIERWEGQPSAPVNYIRRKDRPETEASPYANQNKPLPPTNRPPAVAGPPSHVPAPQGPPAPQAPAFPSDAEYAAIMGYARKLWPDEGILGIELPLVIGKALDKVTAAEAPQIINNLRARALAVPPADFKPEGVAMPNAAAQQRAAAKELAKGEPKGKKKPAEASAAEAVAAVPWDGVTDPFDGEPEAPSAPNGLPGAPQQHALVTAQRSVPAGASYGSI